MSNSRGNLYPMKLKQMKKERDENGDRISSDSNGCRSRSKSIGAAAGERVESDKTQRRLFRDMNNDKKIRNARPHTDQRHQPAPNTKARSFRSHRSLPERLTGPSVSLKRQPAPHFPEPRSLVPPPSLPVIAQGKVVWAVSDVSCVPPGSVLINPETRSPYLNSDGSVYLYQPSNPPRVVLPGQLRQLSHPPAPDLEMARLGLATVQLSGGSHNSFPLMPRRLPQVPLAPSASAHHPPYMPINPMSLHQMPTPGHRGPPPLPCMMNPPPPIDPRHQQNLLDPMAFLNTSSGPDQPQEAPQNPLLTFSLFLSQRRSVHLDLVHSPASLSRAQFTSCLDSLLGLSAPQLHNGHLLFWDAAGMWCNLESLPGKEPVTNTFQIQIYFEREAQAWPTVSALRRVGFLPLEDGRVES